MVEDGPGSTGASFHILGTYRKEEVAGKEEADWTAVAD